MLLMLACQAPPEPLDVGTNPEDLPVEHQMDFAILADAHVYDRAADHGARLQAAVDWLNATEVDLVLVVGDIAWGDGLPYAREILDTLAPVWVPINGDNEVQLGSEEAYDQTFADHYIALAETLDGWEMGPVEVENPETGTTSWFHNLRFERNGVRFVGLDWASRVIDPVMGEAGTLHDFEGGTWRWMVESLDRAVPDEGIVLFSHLPMHLGGFSVADNDRIQAAILPYYQQVWADYAGHYHVNAEESEPGGYELRVTDATWDDTIDLRIVQVDGSRAEMHYTDTLVTVPY